jgi:hypothetical protein
MILVFLSPSKAVPRFSVRSHVNFCKPLELEFPRARRHAPLRQRFVCRSLKVNLSAKVAAVACGVEAAQRAPPIFNLVAAVITRVVAVVVVAAAAAAVAGVWIGLLCTAVRPHAPAGLAPICAVPTLGEAPLQRRQLRRVRGDDGVKAALLRGQPELEEGEIRGELDATLQLKPHQHPHPHPQTHSKREKNG